MVGIGACGTPLFLTSRPCFPLSTISSQQKLDFALVGDATSTEERLWQYYIYHGYTL